MLLRQTVPPSTAPVSLADAREHFVVAGFTDDDALITALVAAAARVVSAWSGRVLTQETWAASFGAGFTGDFVFPKSPVQSVSSITYYDADDVEQTASISDFYLTKDDDRAYLRPKSGAAWPVANAIREDAITVTFVCGYSTCPDNLSRAVAALAAHMYEHRLAVDDVKLSEVPLGISALIEVDRLGWVKA